MLASPANWTAPGTITELKETLRRLQAGKATKEEVQRVVARVVAARREADPVERAAGRMAGEHWRAAFVEIVEALVPDAASLRRRRRKDGAR